MKLTAKFVENVTEAGKYYDSNGLFLHVRPSGAKKWLQRFTFNGRRREIGQGSAKVVPLATAQLSPPTPDKGYFVISVIGRILLEEARSYAR